jgi:hypothetical protein
MILATGDDDISVKVLFFIYALLNKQIEHHLIERTSLSAKGCMYQV